ncbi:MAG: ATP-binding protein, partial [Candidatus Wallbacteria bacterium]|nr:ATP-binding protein [Candidatus Wallbacteria bacterium]
SKVQNGRGVNSPGVSEIPSVVFEELLVNALVHRDYFISASIRLFVFDNRIEIISPGNLPNHLTVGKILSGNSVIRNPILVSFAARGLLPYHGLGSGVRRAIKLWPGIEFDDDRQGCFFVATVRRGLYAGLSGGNAGRKVKGSPKSTPKSSPKSAAGGTPEFASEPRDGILELVLKNPSVTTERMAVYLGISKRAVLKRISRLKRQGKLRRIGPAKGGHWEVIQ